MKKLGTETGNALHSRHHYDDLRTLQSSRLQLACQAAALSSSEAPNISAEPLTAGDIVWASAKLLTGSGHELLDCVALLLVAGSGLQAPLQIFHQLGSHPGQPQQLLQRQGTQTVSFKQQG